MEYQRSGWNFLSRSQTPADRSDEIEDYRNKKVFKRETKGPDIYRILENFDAFIGETVEES